MWWLPGWRGATGWWRAVPSGRALAVMRRTPLQLGEAAKAVHALERATRAALRRRVVGGVHGVRGWSRGSGVL